MIYLSEIHKTHNTLLHFPDILASLPFYAFSLVTGAGAMNYKMEEPLLIWLEF